MDKCRIQVRIVEFLNKKSSFIIKFQFFRIFNFRCLQQGAHLSSVHTRSENEFIMVWLQRQGINTGFLGLYRNNDEQFVWSDGTPSDYFNWENGGVCVPLLNITIIFYEIRF